MTKDVGEYGENLFEELCTFLSWKCTKIPESNVRTPDFEVLSHNEKFIAEISVVDREMNYGKVQGIQVGKIIRDKISEKKGQLQKKEFPTLLVLCGSSVDLTFECMRAAMYGDWTIDIDRFSGKSLNSYCGNNAYMQEQKNTSISVIAYLNEILKNKEDFGKAKPDTVPYITIYHNMYAHKPFSKDFFVENAFLSQVWFTEGAADDV